MQFGFRGSFWLRTFSQDVQSAWDLLLHCAGGRANYMLRELGQRRCRGSLKGIRMDCGHVCATFWAVQSMLIPQSETCAFCLCPWGGIGLRNAERTSPPAYWASWADCLAMFRRARHPDVAALCVRQMQNPRGPPSLVSVQMAAGQLFGVEGFQVPSWEDLAHGLRPPEFEPDDFEPGGAPRRVAARRFHSGRTTTQGVLDGAVHGQ